MDWVTVVFSGLAVVVGAANFLYTQRAVGKREVGKWRREELQKLSGQLLALSTSRQSELLDYYEFVMDRRTNYRRETTVTGSVWDMELIVEQFRLLDANMTTRAEAIFKLHYQAHRHAAEAEPADPLTEIEDEMVDGDELKRLHQELVDEFQAVTGLAVPAQAGLVARKRRRGLSR